MRLKKYEEALNAIRQEIVHSFEAGEVINFDEEKWWQSLLEARADDLKRRREKYPYILFRRLLRERRHGHVYRMPNLFELPVGVCHGQESKVEDYIRKGMILEDWYFPKLEDIIDQTNPHSNGGIVHLHSWKRKLAEEQAPWAGLESYLYMKKGDQQASYELQQKLLKSQKQNQELLAKLEKAQSYDVSNSDKGQGGGKRKKSEAAAEQSADHLQGSVKAKDGSGISREA